ncbi:hypothetical protein EDD92_0959 [Streptomyces sp. TLI_185]|nr:hypothetical protein EDD92_0959 [Streptomyces sp. TLI_185]
MRFGLSATRKVLCLRMCSRTLAATVPGSGTRRPSPGARHLRCRIRCARPPPCTAVPGRPRRPTVGAAASCVICRSHEQHAGHKVELLQANCARLPIPQPASSHQPHQQLVGGRKMLRDGHNFGQRRQPHRLSPAPPVVMAARAPAPGRIPDQVAVGDGVPEHHAQDPVPIYHRAARVAALLNHPRQPAPKVLGLQRPDGAVPEIRFNMQAQARLVLISRGTRIRPAADVLAIHVNQGS